MPHSHTHTTATVTVKPWLQILEHASQQDQERRDHIDHDKAIEQAAQAAEDAAYDLDHDMEQEWI